jgi:diacylglycerol kinase family enzyme
VLETGYGTGVRRYLLVNPRSGSVRPTADELTAEAVARGIDVHVVVPGDDAAELAARAELDVLGVAGGDGTVSSVAAIAVERELPFAVVPFGTRNHFARDVGLDPDDPVTALDSFAGREHRVDVGRVGERLFLNNVSLGAYARLVHRRERHRRRREALAQLRALVLVLRNREPIGARIDGERVRGRVLLIANNAYALDLFSLGERERLDGGLLHLYIADGPLPPRWTERTGERFTIELGAKCVRAAIDGEPVELSSPLEVRIEPRRLRLLLPDA